MMRIQNANKNRNPRLNLGLGRFNLGHVLVSAILFFPLLSSFLVASAQTPSISITSPQNGAMFTVGEDVVIKVSATISEGTIDSVDFYRAGSYIGSDNSSPYEITFENISAGGHAISVAAVGTFEGISHTWQGPQIVINATSTTGVGAGNGSENGNGTNTVPPTIPLPNPSGINTIPDLLKAIITWLTIIMVPILTIMILIGGFKMLTARDNETQFTAGKKTVTYAAIGAAVVLVANGIALVIQSFLTGS